jgi:hypothetical protein
MDDMQTPKTMEQPQVDPSPSDLPPGIKVYERPKRRTFPLWLALGLLLLMSMLAWFIYQAIF